MALKNLFDMVKADRYTADGREAIIKAQEEEIEDKVYQIGEISQKTGLQKTANGWVKPKNGKQPEAKKDDGSIATAERNMDVNEYVKYLEQDLKQAQRTKAGPDKEFNIKYKILETLAGGTDAAFESFKEAKKTTASKEEALEQALNKYKYSTEKKDKAKQTAGTRHAEKRKTNRPKAIRWDRNNLNEMRGNEEYINAKAADNYYHQYGLDKIDEYKDSKGWTVKEYKNDDGETYRAKYDGEKYVGSEYDPSGEIMSTEEKPAAATAAGPSDEEIEIFKDVIREFKKNPNKKNEQIMNEAKSHLMKNRGMTPEQLGKIGRDVYSEKTKDSAPRQLTGDTKIRVRK